MSLPADFDVRSMDHGEYRVLRIYAAIEAIYDRPGARRPDHKPLPAGRMTCREAVRRYEAWRLGRLP